MTEWMLYPQAPRFKSPLSATVWSGIEPGTFLWQSECCTPWPPGLSLRCQQLSGQVLSGPVCDLNGAPVDIQSSCYYGFLKEQQRLKLHEPVCNVNASSL